jgi:hypothetical protein
MTRYTRSTQRLLFPSSSLSRSQLVLHLLSTELRLSGGWRYGRNCRILLERVPVSAGVKGNNAKGPTDGLHWVVGFDSSSLFRRSRGGAAAGDDAVWVSFW